jgi:16S rRNA (guanine527-N7)-methyltransferase
MMSDADDLKSALTRHGIELADDQIALLDRYCRLLWDWNTKINLTRHTDYERFVTRDVVDSLELSRLIPADERVLDVGTGGGLPGVVIAVVRPDLEVSLCESVAKKARVTAQIVEQLKLPVDVYHARAEQVLQDEAFDALVVRAVAPLWKLLTWMRPHWGAMRRMLIIKGPAWTEERGEARHRGLMHDVSLRKAAEYLTPGTQAQNVILQVEAKS